MRRLSIVGIMLALASLALWPSGANAVLALLDLTPTAFAYAPVIINPPTPTPSNTPTITMTPTPSSTPTITMTPTPFGTLPPPSIFPIEGVFTMVENKPSYATYIEWIKFYQSIHNVTDQAQNFGILGTNVEGPITMPFKTSWDGAGAGGFLTINASCWGPVNMNANPCAPDATAGRSEDHVGDGPDEHTAWEVTVPGQYRLAMYICLSSYSACQQPGVGDWRQIGQPQIITAIDWTPTPPPQGVQPRATATASAATACYLITNDPRGVYLSCPEARWNHKVREHRR